MIVAYGFYSWFPRRTAFRRDYCRVCKCETTSFLLRTFKVFHLFWIPLVPLGFWGSYPWGSGASGFAKPVVSRRMRR